MIPLTVLIQSAQQTARALSSASGSFPGTERKTEQQRGDDPNDMIDKWNTGLQIDTPLATSDKYYFRLRMYDYKRPMPTYGNQRYGNATYEEKEEQKYQLILPLPMTLSDQVGVKYTAEAVGLAGEVVDILRGSNGNNVDQSIRDVLENATSTLGNRAVYALSAQTLQTINNLIPGAAQSNIAALIQQSFGAAVNPNESLMMGGPDLRAFEYRWIIIPHSQKESDDIHQTIRRLKARSLPYIAKSESSRPGVATGLLGYPQLCRVNFYPWDYGSDRVGNIKQEWTRTSIIKYKRAVLEQVSASYNSQNPSAFFAGNTNYPVSIALTLRFREVEYFLSEDEGADLDYKGQYVDTPVAGTQSLEETIRENSEEARNPSLDTSTPGSLSRLFGRFF